MSKPTLQSLRARCPEVPEARLRAHLDGLEEAYFARFDLETVAGHLRLLASMGDRQPVAVLVDAGEDGELVCTVLSHDHRFLFSLITGTLAALGFEIRSGEVFTSRSAAPPLTDAGPRRGRPRRPAHAPPARGIIDCFVGRLEACRDRDAWRREVETCLGQVVGWLGSGKPDAAERARRQVNEMVVRRLSARPGHAESNLLPVEISFDPSVAGATRMRVTAQDTPAFLYSLSAALSLQSISIERVRIRTEAGQVCDELDLVDREGQPLAGEQALHRVRFAVLLTKQFTYFLDQAPAPYDALQRFEHMVEDLLALPEQTPWLDVLANPRTMQDLARLLGASDFLWEDFIRQQYESLLPLIAAGGGARTAEQHDGLPVAESLRRAVETGDGFEDRCRILNEFKDRETFLADLDHILNPAVGFRAFAERLTRLAEAVVNTAGELVYRELVARFGTPRTVGGLPAAYAILGLGKLGGAALGYASDVELLFVYSDGGHTEGDPGTSNADFFERLARDTRRCIRSKQKGIFRVDLRLRPHGASGPRAASLEAFCRYYGPGGPAHSFERLALVRLRAVGGDRELGRRIERLRDEFVYANPSIVVAELRELRARQYREKATPDRVNAKFSPGALVDLEYAVQILQVMHGKSIEALRTPRIHVALEALRAARVVGDDECDRLSAAYDFLRVLINGLRMLRGSAEDLFLPAVDDPEYLHLARRMGYRQQADLDPARQLRMSMETHTAAVRAFVERHFGRGALPGPATGTVADLVLSDSVPAALRTAILNGYGFRNPSRAYANLRSLAGDGPRRDLFARLGILACDILAREPDPDMALNNWERFVRSLPDAPGHVRRLLDQPRRLEVLLALFSRSQYLADLMIRAPDVWDWVTNPANLQQAPGRDALIDALRTVAAAAADHETWLDALRRFHHRELLRIGTRDIVVGVDTPHVIRELSDLADALIEVALRQVWRMTAPGVPDAVDAVSGFCVMAFGKLGGRELNYSSDVDLIGVYDPARLPDGDPEPAARAMMRLHRDLSQHRTEGHVYRVDLRLRPYGRAGEVVSSLPEMERYYQDQADLWELQAALKLRPVAGDRELGARLQHLLRTRAAPPPSPRAVADSIRRLRDRTVRGLGDPAMPFNVKEGEGGIRDLEFLIQGLQMIHAGREHAALLTGNTLEAIARLAEAGLLPADTAHTAAADYVLLRRLEHCLQIRDNRQTSSMPAADDERTALARALLGPDGSARDLDLAVAACRTRIRQAYNAFLDDAAHA